MTITLTPEQLRWLEQQVAGGHFESVEDAVQLAVAGMMTIDTEPGPSHWWTKPALPWRAAKAFPPTQ